MAENAASLIDEILGKLSLNTTTPTAISRAFVLRELNNCLKDLAENTRLLIKKDTTTLALVAGTATYTLPEDLYEVSHLEDYETKQIYPTTLQVLESYSNTWQDDSGEVRWYILDFDAPKTITFYNNPDSTYTSKYVTMRYHYYATDLTDSASSYIPAPLARHRKMLIDWALGQLLLMESEVQNIQKSQMYMQTYYAERNKWDKKSIAPTRTIIYGSNGKNRPQIDGPKMPDNYPALKW